MGSPRGVNIFVLGDNAQHSAAIAESGGGASPIFLASHLLMKPSSLAGRRNSVVLQKDNSPISSQEKTKTKSDKTGNKNNTRTNMKTHIEEMREKITRKKRNGTRRTGQLQRWSEGSWLPKCTDSSRRLVKTSHVPNSIEPQLLTARVPAYR